jgi:hypothetical protein
LHEQVSRGKSIATLVLSILGRLDESWKVPMIRSTATSTASLATGMISLPSKWNQGPRRSL